MKILIIISIKTTILKTNKLIMLRPLLLTRIIIIIKKILSHNRDIVFYPKN